MTAAKLWQKTLHSSLRVSEIPSNIYINQNTLSFKNQSLCNGATSYNASSYNVFLFTMTYGLQRHVFYPQCKYDVIAVKNYFYFRSTESGL